jgi:hypothetical protein
MRGLEQLMDVYTRVRRRLNPNLEIIGIVPTMVDVRRTNDQQILQEVTKAYPGMLLDVLVKESIKFADAPRHQRSILELDPRHDGARAYRQLARLVLRHYGEYAEPEPYPVPEEAPDAPPQNGAVDELMPIAVPVNGGGAEPETAEMPSPIPESPVLSTSREPQAEPQPLESSDPAVPQTPIA